MRSYVGRFSLCLPLVAAVAFSPATSAVTIDDWSTVGDLGNPADTEIMNDTTSGYGSVPYTYQIAKYEVTNSQYAEFLTNVAASDPNGLWNPAMSAGFGGITRNGIVDGSFSHSPILGRGDMPVTYVSVYDAMRFANWLHNGQPTGSQGNLTTEDGSYTITAQGIANNSITRNAGATIVLPSENDSTAFRSTSTRKSPRSSRG